jgi:signal transduction histidine kinase
VRDFSRPLVIGDAREEPLFRDNPAIGDLGVVAYLGMPILGPGDAALGAACAIDGVPRAWTTGEFETLRVLADAASAQVRMRAALAETATAARARDVFTGILVEEMRPQIEGIGTLSRVIAAEAASPDHRAFAATIEGTGAALAATLEDMLGFAELGFGAQTARRAPFRPDEAVAIGLERGAGDGAAAERGLSVETWIDPVLSSLRIGDREKLERLSALALGQAIGFCERGTVRFEARLRGPGHLEILVSDPGPSETHRPEPCIGTGSGEREGGREGRRPRLRQDTVALAIIRRLVELMGGTCGVEDAEGGCRLRIALPCPPALPEPADWPGGAGAVAPALDAAGG